MRTEKLGWNKAKRWGWVLLLWFGCKIHCLVEHLLQETSSCSILNKHNASVYPLAYQAQWASWSFTEEFSVSNFYVSEASSSVEHCSSCQRQTSEETTNKQAHRERRSKWRKELKHVCVWYFTVTIQIIARQRQWQPVFLILTSARNHNINFQRTQASRTDPSFHSHALILPIPLLTSFVSPVSPSTPSTSGLSSPRSVNWIIIFITWNCIHPS